MKVGQLNPIVQFVLHFTLYVGILYVLVQVLVAVLNNDLWLSLFFNELLFFQYALTIIVFGLSIFGVKRGPEIGVFTILGGVVIKLILSLSFFLVLFLKGIDNQLILGLNFFSTYFLLSVFEVIYLLRNLRHQN